MPKMSSQTRSFTILTIVAVFGVFFCLLLWADLIYFPYSPTLDYTYPNITKAQNYNPDTFLPVHPVDTAGWKTYSHEGFSYSFKYKPGWRVLAPKQKSGFTIFEVDPGRQFYNIKIYISPKEFYIMDALPAKNEIIGGAETLNVNNLLYGIKANNLYYTFDIGLSLSLVQDFNALVRSVQFTN